MTKNEMKILREAKDEAMDKYFKFRLADEEVRQESNYKHSLDVYLTVACEYIDLFQKLGIK